MNLLLFGTLDHYLQKMISNITKNTCIRLKQLNLQDSNQPDIFDLVENACNLFGLNLRLVNLNNTTINDGIVLKFQNYVEYERMMIELIHNAFISSR